MKNNVAKLKECKNIILGSILLTLIIFSQNVMFLSNSIFGNTLVFKILLVFGGLLSVCFFKINISLKSVTLFLFVLLFFFLTFIFKNNASLGQKFISFILYSIPALCYSNCKFEEKLVYKYGIVIGYIWLLFYVLINGLKEVNSFSFGYCILPLCICSYLFFRFSSNKIETIFGIISFISSLFFLILFGSRGPVICIILFFFLYFVPKLKDLKNKFLYMSCIILFSLLLINFEDILILLHNSLPFNISFIEKSYLLLLNSNSGLTNGRIEIFKDVFGEYSFSDLILGIGIGNYATSHAINEYTHNIFLSALLDFGFVGIVFLFYIFCSFISSIYKKRNNILIFLFSISILVLLFSGEYLEMYSFWLFVFYFLNLTKRRKYDKV